MVEFEIVRYQFMKVNGSGATKINVVGKYFFRLTNVKMFWFPSDYLFKLIAWVNSEISKLEEDSTSKHDLEKVYELD